VKPKPYPGDIVAGLLFSKLGLIVQSSAMRCFQGVIVDFPAGAAAHHTKDNWQNANWVMWGQGELRIDSASFAMVFSPEGCSSLAAKPLGCLTSASIAASGEAGSLSSFIAATNDPVHALVRLNFQSLMDEEAFTVLAEAAKSSSCGRFPGCNGSRRSSMGMGRRSSVYAGVGCDSLPEAFKTQIYECHPDAWPLIYGAAELYGPDPQGDQGSEVLLGRGAVVLLDPQESARVGNYELIFYDEGYPAPMVRWAIGPRLRLDPVRDAMAGQLDGRASIAPRRLSSDRGGRMHAGAVPTSFNLVVPGNPPTGLTFDTEADSAGFMRDLSVRQRLVAVSLKTSRGWRTVEELQDELSDMRRRGFIATIQRLVYQAVLLVAISWFIYACALYSHDLEQPPLDVAMTALGDASAAVSAFGAWVADIGSATCSLLVRAVPAVDVQRCVALPEAAEARACAAALVGAPPSWAAGF